MHRSNQRTAASAGWIFLLATALTQACGSDNNTAGEQPVSSGGTTASAGKPATGGMIATGGTTASAGKSGTPLAGTPALAGRPAAAGGGGRTGGAAGADLEDAGVPPDAGLVAGAGGGAAGAAGASAGHGGAAAGSGGGAAGGGASNATFTRVYAVFMANCMGANCHVGAMRPSDMLSLADKNTAYMNLVNMASMACSGEKRVVPNQPDKSVLVHALAHKRVGSCARTPQMPQGRAKLSQSDIQLVTDWVNAGAPNN
jgi:hypothetical protein